MNKTITLMIVLVSTLSFAQSTPEVPSDAPTVAAPTVAAPPAPAAPRLLKNGKYRFTGTVPDGFKLVSAPRVEFIGAGAGALAGAYLLEVLGTAFISHQSVGYVPIVGSLLGLPERLSSYGQSASQSANWAAGVLLPVAGFIDVVISAVICAAQVAGITLIIVGVAKPHQWLEKTESAGVKVSLVPMSAGAPMGASLVATF